MALKTDIDEVNRQLMAKATWQDLHHVEEKEIEDRSKIETLLADLTDLELKYAESSNELNERLAHITGLTDEN